MCGRYTLWELNMLDDRFEVDQEELAAIRLELHERYNIAPTQFEPVVTMDNKRHIQLMRWGFVAPWMKEPKDTFKYSSFNARSEDIFNKPMWKKAIRENRCLVPSNGFYEWLKTPSRPQPYFIKPKDQDLFGFAGIYNLWRDVEGLEWPTYSIITSTANSEMLDIHHRQPVIVHPKDEDRWLNPKNDALDSIGDIMQPYKDGGLEIVKVSRDVNNSRLDDKSLILPLAK